MKKKAVTREYRPRYQKATKKEKSALLAEFTRFTPLSGSWETSRFGKSWPMRMARQ
ncbi:MAG: hypothetical protein LBC51_10110 [Treponema sp.]|nr:hypothetical protein [Treponema sp.]